MSESTRAHALTEAVRISLDAGTHDADLIVNIASTFDTFLADAFGAPKAVSTPADEPKVVKETKPKADKKPAPVAKPAGPTKEQVGKAITALISGGQRDAAVALLAEYGATNVSTLPVESYQDVLDAAAELSVAG